MRVYQFRHVGTVTALLLVCCVFCNKARILKDAPGAVNSVLLLL